MTKHILLVRGVIALIIAMTTAVQADIPQLISFQGKLYDNTSNPLTGIYEITFRIYDAESNGTELWSETDSVDCENGLYNVILGLIAPIDLNFDGQYWLGVQVTDDEELLPRYRLVSVPTAFRAQVANQVSWTNLTNVPAGFTDGIDDVGAAIDHQHDDRYYTETELNTNDGVLNEAGDPVSWNKIKDMPSGFADGDDNVGGNGAGGGWVDEGTVVHLDSSADKVGIGTPTPGAKCDIFAFDDDPLYVRKMILGSDVALLTVKNNGNVGIGTEAPETKLEIEDTTAGNHTAYFHIDNADSPYSGLYAKTAGTGNGVTGFTSGSGNGLSGFADGEGNAVQGYTTGTGHAGLFEIDNPSSFAHAVYAKTNGSDAIYAEANGTGKAGHFEITNASNDSAAIYATTNGNGEAVYATTRNNRTLYASNTGDGDAIHAHTMGQGYAVYGKSTGTGTVAGFEIDNTSSNGSAVTGRTNGTGYAGYFENMGTVAGLNDIALVAKTADPIGNWAGYFEGDIYVTDDLSVKDGKYFMIDHPTKPDHILLHACLEGPEKGVFYRGQAHLINGEAIVILPDYFETLTRKENRTVLLTPKGTRPFLLSCTDVVNGKFTVYGTKSDGEFFWEVKAVRGDVETLEEEVIKLEEAMR